MVEGYYFISTMNILNKKNQKSLAISMDVLQSSRGGSSALLFSAIPCLNLIVRAGKVSILKDALQALVGWGVSSLVVPRHTLAQPDCTSGQSVNTQGFTASPRGLEGPKPWVPCNSYIATMNLQVLLATIYLPRYSLLLFWPAEAGPLAGILHSGSYSL